MTKNTRFATRRSLFVIATAVVLLTVAGLLLHPEILSFSPHSLEVKSESLNVRGVYWKLPLACVDSLTLVSNKLTVQGKYLPLLGYYAMRAIRRSIPSVVRATELHPDNGWTTWTESDLTFGPAGRTIFWRSIVNRKTGQHFSFAIPFKDYFEILNFYHGPGDTSVAIFAFGKIGQDAQSLMGYILITNKVPK